MTKEQSESTVTSNSNLRNAVEKTTDVIMKVADVVSVSTLIILMPIAIYMVFLHFTK